MSAELFEEALAARGVKRRVAVLRSYIRELFVAGEAEGPSSLSEVGDNRAVFDLLRLLEQTKDDRKSTRVCFFLLSAQLRSRGYEEHLRLYPDGVMNNSIRQRVLNIPHESSILLRGFFILQVCTFLPVIGDREAAETHLRTILDEMGDQGYPVLKKTFFGKSRAVAALNDSISLWQSVFSAMRRMKYVPPSMDHFTLLFTALKSDNIVLQRHACALLSDLAGTSVTDEGLYDRVLAYIVQSEAEESTCGFPLADHLCRTSVLKLLSRLTDNENGVSIEQLATLYTRIYGHIEDLDGPMALRTKSIADRVHYFVGSSRSWPLKVALSTRDNNVFSGTLSLLSLQIETLPVTDPLFPLILRASARVGRFFVRKCTECDSHLAGQKHLNNDIRDYNCVAELCRHLNARVSSSEISRHAFLRLPHVLTQALVSLAWLSPTDERVSLAESQGVTDEFWVSLQRKFRVSMPYLGLDGCVSFLDNLFRRLEESTLMRYDTGSSAVTWTELRPYHLGVYLALCNMALEVLVHRPDPRSAQLLHNLWAWTDAMLRQTPRHGLRAGHAEDTGAAKRGVQTVFCRNVSFLISRDFSVPSEEGGGTHRALADLRRYGVWLLAEHSLVWVEGPEGGAEVLNALQVALTATALTRSSLALALAPSGDRSTFTALAKLCMRITYACDPALTRHQDSRYQRFRGFLESEVLAMLGPAVGEGPGASSVNPLALASPQLAAVVTGTPYEPEPSLPPSQQLSRVHEQVDSTWTSRQAFQTAEEVTRDRDRGTREQQERHLRGLVDARERAATEYRTYKPEEHEEAAERVDTHAQYLCVIQEKEKARERREQEELERRAALRRAEGIAEGEEAAEADAPFEPTPDSPKKEGRQAGEGGDVAAPRQGWVPTPHEKATMDRWFERVEGSETGLVSAAALVKFLGPSRDNLSARRIGSEQLRALWNSTDTRNAGAVDRDSFYVFVRLLMIACAGRKPSLEFYFETASNRRLPLPPLQVTPADAPSPAPASAPASAPLVTASVAAAPPPIVWEPVPETKQAISAWLATLSAKVRASGSPNNRAAVAAFLGTCGISVEVLKRIWALVGLNEKIAAYSDVTEDKFTVLVRLVSLTARGIEPTVANYRATSTDQSIPLAPFRI